MKKCSYCGGEFPDETTICPIDQTSFEKSQTETPLKLPRPTFAVFTETKIPLSLAIVSYFFFVPAADCFANVFFSFILLIFAEGINEWRGIVLPCTIYALVGIFFVCISRGLRKNSRGWRICALVCLWIGFIGFVNSIFQRLLNILSDHPDPLPASLLAHKFPLQCLCFVVWIWCYRILRRQHIRELFGVV